MFSVLLKRSTFAAQRVSLWAATPQRCWSSVLTRASGGGSSSLQTCWASSTWQPFTERDNGQVKPLPVLKSRRNELLKGAQTFATHFLQRNQHFHSSAVRLKKREKPDPPPRELDLLRYDMEDFWKSPKPALYLGLGGLIPFVLPTLYMAGTETFIPELGYAQVAYTASIVSFLGGCRWGFALPESSPAKPDWINLANSVVPSLFAWITMLMTDSIVSAAIMGIISLGVALHYDLSLLPTYPSWLKALRAVLTFVAFFSLVGTLFIHSLYPEKKMFSD